MTPDLVYYEAQAKLEEERLILVRGVVHGSSEDQPKTRQRLIEVQACLDAINKAIRDKLGEPPSPD